MIFIGDSRKSGYRFFSRCHIYTVKRTNESSNLNMIFKCEYLILFVYFLSHNFLFKAILTYC